MSYKLRKILTTGSAGFIGSNFVHYMLAKYQDIQIISLDKLTYAGNLSNLNNLPDESRHVFVQGDICDRKLIDQLLHEHHIDTIVHFAAESHVDRSITGPAAFVETNVIGTFTLLEAARNYWLDEKHWDDNQCRFHHISTDEVFGFLGPSDPPFTEKTCYDPSSPYSASKAASDHFVRAYSRTYGLPATVSNCSNNYGPRQHPEKMIPTIIRCCLEQKPIPIYGDGSNIRDWLYVDDHCHAIDLILRTGKTGETYNIGSDCEMSNLDLAKLICSLMDEKFPKHKPHAKLISFVKDRPGHDWRYAIDTMKIKKELGWNPQYNLKKGLLKTIGYYIDK
ncbi:MAG: dTDP-glucose 4,6-dehydratase [Gammaproteobacteria bacterium]|nr:dTDP-glucose 4,6-dehydratase [Gammaproteobacteria bacterium]